MIKRHSFGFLSTDDDNSPGNYGLKDQVAALKWVKDNIKAFGGNPDDVTIFGNSAGAASVNYHMLSTASKGLFKRAISESGTALATWGVPEPGLGYARKTAALVGCPTEPNAALVECLRGVDQFKLTRTLVNFTEWFFCPLTPFRPAVEKEREGAFLTDHPSNLKPHSDIPWLVGVNAEEASVFTGAFVANKTMLQELDQNRDKLLPMCLDYRKSPKAKLVTETIWNHYFPSGKPSVNGSTDMLSDGLFTWRTDESVRKYKGKAPIYYYVFSYRGKHSMSEVYSGGRNTGVAHTDELFYLFSNNPLMPITDKLPPKDMEMAMKLTKLWTDFAKTGNPTPNNDPVCWPEIRLHKELEYLDINLNMQVKQGLFQKRIDFWNTLSF